MRCGSCGWDNPAGIVFCTNCGARISGGAPETLTASGGQTSLYSVPASQRQSMGMTACRCCGAACESGSRFCRECGASIVEEATRPSNAPCERGDVARLVTVVKDGSEGCSIPLAERDMDIGGSEGDLTFPDDPYLSPRHARIVYGAGTYRLRDLDSVNGVYVRLRESVEVRDRDVFLIGQQVLRFELIRDGELALGPASQKGVLVFGAPEAVRLARLVQYTTEGVGRDVYYLFRDETIIGREHGDIVFTNDPFLSRRHAALRVDHVAGRLTLHDLGSANGTAIRIRGEHVLRDGDQFRIGRHLFRFEAGSVAGSASVVAPAGGFDVGRHSR